MSVGEVKGWEQFNRNSYGKHLLTNLLDSWSKSIIQTKGIVNLQQKDHKVIKICNTMSLITPIKPALGQVLDSIRMHSGGDCSEIIYNIPPNRNFQSGMLSVILQRDVFTS